MNKIKFNIAINKSKLNKNTGKFKDSMNKFSALDSCIKVLNLSSYAIDYTHHNSFTYKEQFVENAIQDCKVLCKFFDIDGINHRENIQKIFQSTVNDIFSSCNIYRDNLNKGLNSGFFKNKSDIDKWIMRNF